MTQSFMETGQYLEFIADTFQISSDNNRLWNLECLTGKWVHCVTHDDKKHGSTLKINPWSHMKPMHLFFFPLFYTKMLHLENSPVRQNPHTKYKSITHIILH